MEVRSGRCCTATDDLPLLSARQTQHSRLGTVLQALNHCRCSYGDGA